MPSMISIIFCRASPLARVQPVVVLLVASGNRLRLRHVFAPAFAAAVGMVLVQAAVPGLAP